MLERWMFKISQESEDLDIVEKRKSAETVKKLVDTVIVCENELKKFKEEAEPVNIIFNQLNLIQVFKRACAFCFRTAKYDVDTFVVHTGL